MKFLKLWFPHALGFTINPIFVSTPRFAANPSKYQNIPTHLRETWRNGGNEPPNPTQVMLRIKKTGKGTLLDAPSAATNLFFTPSLFPPAWISYHKAGVTKYGAGWGKHWNNLDEKRDKNCGKAASKIPPLRLSPEDLHPVSLLPCRIHKSCFVWVFPSFCTQNVITSQLLWNYCFGISFPFFLQVTSSCLQKYFPCFSHYFFPSNTQLIWFLAITKHWACSFVGFLSHIQDRLQP